MTTILVAGPTGRMGKAVLELLSEDQTVSGTGLPRTTKPVPSGDVVIDFTVPEALINLLKTDIQSTDGNLAPIVTGTTGLTGEQQELVQQSAKHRAIVQAGNFSLGIAVLSALVRRASETLQDFDIEITEAHHRRKVDSPSGTALMLGEAAAAGLGVNLDNVAIHGRKGIVGARTDEEIGFAVTRAGGIIGDHSVVLASENEMLTLSHRAFDRKLFAAGAIAAAKWVIEKPPGLYGMADVLRLV